MNAQSIKFLALAGFVSIFAASCDKDDPTPTVTSTTVYTSNNANGDVTYYDVTDRNNVKATTLVTSSTAADGVYYDASADAVIQASRSGNALEGYLNITGMLTGELLNIGITGAAGMDSPRETAVNGNFYVVADNKDVDGDATTPDGRLFIFTKSGSSFSLRNVITTDFKLWGITFIGDDLYAVVDADNELAVFTNFLNNNTDKQMSASKRVVIEGITRTHGITYDASTSTLIMTDIGSATNTQDDGGFHVIKNFMTKFNATANNGTIAVSDQVRVSGAATMMGNPVDVAYDGATGTVFIAEAGNGGGRILAFENISGGGNLTPSMNYDLASASAVYLSKK